MEPSGRNQSQPMALRPKPLPQARCLRRQDFVAHSWSKRRFGDWLNHAERRQPFGKKYLQMGPFRDVRG
jgi:hypothetical protein